jgi:hypothetical protein
VAEDEEEDEAELVRSHSGRMNSLGLIMTL